MGEARARTRGNWSAATTRTWWPSEPSAWSVWAQDSCSTESRTVQLVAGRLVTDNFRHRSINNSDCDDDDDVYMY